MITFNNVKYPEQIVIIECETEWHFLKYKVLNLFQTFYKNTNINNEDMLCFEYLDNNGFSRKNYFFSDEIEMMKWYDIETWNKIKSFI